MFSFFPVAYAADDFDTLLSKINQHILNPIIGFLFVLATALFVLGLVRYYLMGGEKDREAGKRHIAWGLAGMFIMVSVFGIMKLIVTTFGIDLGQFGTGIPPQ